VTQQKSETSKTTAQKPAGKSAVPSVVPPPKRYEQYTLKADFWDSLLDSIPPWGSEIVAIALIVFGIISFLALINVSADATIATAWAGALRSLFGQGSVLIAGGIFGLGIALLLPRMGIDLHFPMHRLLALEIAFLAGLALLHLAPGQSELRALARAGQGGGLVGFALSFSVAGLLGSFTAIVFYSIVMVISLAAFFGVRIREVKIRLEKAGTTLKAFAEQYAPAGAPPLFTFPPKQATKPGTQPSRLDVPGVTVANAAPPKATAIFRIKPDLDALPPSLRNPVPAVELPSTKRGDLAEELGLAKPSLLSLGTLSANFNAIGEVKGKRVKGQPVQVERPDGRIKRYFTVADMKEIKKLGKRDSALPPLELMQDIELNLPNEQEINNNVVLIENTLLEFEIDVDVVDVKVGPTVTQYAVQPFKEESGDSGELTVVNRTRISKIASFANDLALALSAKRLRLETPVPGHSYVGIEVPNRNPSIVALRSVYESKNFQDQLGKAKSPLLIPLGRDVAGLPLAIDLAQMPHLLIAGTTGSGKSVCIAAMIGALLLNNSPDDVKLVMLDPKMVELTRYNGVPHLIGPVETDQERIIEVLRWCTREMDRRYKLLEDYAARNITDYNSRLSRRQKDEMMPYIVILIDEIGDLMLSRPEETEKLVTRLAQKARAAGMHMVIATQRPSVDVITGLIKANFPSRISFAVASGVDSRVILDSIGAENLLGRGDMLYLASDAAGPRRVQGCFVSDDEVRKITGWWKDWGDSQVKAGKPDYPKTGPWERGLTRRELLGETDEMLEQAIEFVVAEGEASASVLQRRLGLGYPRAARLVDLMAELGIVGEAEPGGRSRKVLIKPGQDPFKVMLERKKQSQVIGGPRE
jgi:S-DNA-T family DNA segregation ATPase FtsK/SpoIIIE